MPLYKYMKGRENRNQQTFQPMYENSGGKQKETDENIVVIMETNNDI